MGLTTFTTNSGHIIEVEGDIAEGQTVTVIVKPKQGYEFVKWNNAETLFTDIGTTDEGYKKYSLKIVECGIVLSGLFNIICDVENLYKSLNDLICTENDVYEESSVDCDEIELKLLELIGCQQ